MNSKEERLEKRRAEREKWKELKGARKLQYIWDYYKLPLFVLGVCLYIIGYLIYGRLTHKDPVLYAALVNINAGDRLIEQLNDGFLQEQSLDSSKKKLVLYTGLYVTQDEKSPYYQYAYASRVKILASINAKQMDVVLMDQEAFDAFSREGYLCNMEEFLSQEDPKRYEKLRSALAVNTVVLEDNALDADLDPSVTYSARTVSYATGLELSDTAIIRDAGFTDPVYLGILANTPRSEVCLNYLEYLFDIPDA